MNKSIIITTINKPSKALNLFSIYAKKKDYLLIIVGDLKTPKDFTLPNSYFLNVYKQKKIFSKMASLLPYNHYARKNLGYLMAIKNNIEIIVDTDDDNIPYKNFWTQNIDRNYVDVVCSKKKWHNIYSSFTDIDIWPRGYPLEYIMNHSKDIVIEKRKSSKLIIQYLANKSPDVDAVFRLTSNKKVYFKKNLELALDKYVWCPFNSQNTVYKKESFPLLYLPSYCSFRMTDIWRSFIAQRCLWEIGEYVVFKSPTVYQERNYHNLFKDFKDEISGYLLNDQIIDILNECKLGNNLNDNLFICYEQLVKKKIFPKKELNILKQWINEIEYLQSRT